MKFKNEIWAFIPARAGSKSIINKNIRLVKKKPLLAHTLIFSDKIKKFKKVIFSSDSSKYIKIAEKFSKCTTYLRPKKYAKDATTDLEVFKDFIKFSIKNKNILPEYFAHMRPTTPIRDKKLVQKAIKKFLSNKKKYSSMRSVSKMSNPSYKTFIIKKNKLCSLFGNDHNLDKYNKPKELFSSTYLPNGYIDIIKTKNIINDKFHGNKVLPFIINKNVIEIDSKIELQLLNKKQK